MGAQFDKVTIWLLAYIPMPSVNALGRCFIGDDRGVSSDYNEQRFRVRSEISISGFLAGAPETIEFHQVGETHELNCETGDVIQIGHASTDGLRFHGFSVGGTYPDPEGGVIDNPNEYCANVLYDGVTNNPLMLSPDIDFNFFFTVDPVGRTVSVRGAVNDFPDYEGYVSTDDGAPVMLFQHPHGTSPAFGLPGGADQSIRATVPV